VLCCDDARRGPQNSRCLHFLLDFAQGAVGMTKSGERSETGEAIEVGAEDVALEGEVGEFSLALDANQAGGFEFFHVMGERRRADGLGFAERGAGGGALAAADLGKDLVATGSGEGFRDEGELAVGNASLLRRDFGPLRGDAGPLRRTFGTLRGNIGSPRGEGRFLCRAETLFCHLFLPYRLEAGLPEKFILRRLTYIKLLHTVRIC
jgi:hypothetical protein